jgi:hypothetical protein
MKIIYLNVFCVIGIIFGFYIRYKRYIPTFVAEKIHLTYTDPTLGTDLFEFFGHPLIFSLSVLLIFPIKKSSNVPKNKLLVSIGVILIVLALYVAPSYFDFRELANTATIEANQGKPIPLTKSLILGIAIERFPEKGCAIFRWENCMPLIGCTYL